MYTGRFISPDGYVSTGQGLIGNNMYAYCNNNPVMYKDPNGDFPWLILGIALIASSVYVAVTSTVISDISEEDEITKSVFSPGKDCDTNVLYYDFAAQTIFDNTASVEMAVGLYDETVIINDYNRINLDVMKASTTIGYTGFSAGIYLAELSGTYTINLFGREVEISAGVNYGWGASMNLGKKSVFGVSNGVGFIISIEVMD